MKASPNEEWDFKGRRELEMLLEESSLKKEDICLVGSISLSVRGLREHGDVDFCVRSELHNQLNENSSRDVVSLVKDRYENIDISDDELIENQQYHDVVDGFKVVRPEITFSYKKLRDLPKDEKDVELLENYSLATDDWDWDLYRSDYSQRPNSLLSRGLQSLQSDGLLITAHKIVGLLSRKYPVVHEIANTIPVHDIRTPIDTITDTERTVNTARLLNRQYAGTEFVKWDVVAYWAAINAFEAEKTPQFDFEKLNIDRETLKSLDEAELEPIAVSQKHRILEPKKFAQAVYEKRENIRVVPRFERSSRRDKEWLREQGLDESECTYLAEQRLEMLESVGSLFYAIFWPTTHEYFDEMEEALGEKVLIRESLDIEIDDMAEFVKDIYDAQTDHAPAWAIDWKADHMTKYPPVVRIVKIELPNPRLRDGISREMEMIKNDVRHQFVEHFPDEYYLSLLHSTDSFVDNLKAKNVLERYSD